MVSNYGTHVSHCCSLHGCKYGNEDCPVANGEAEQDYLCEYCPESIDDAVSSVEASMESLKHVLKVRAGQARREHEKRGQV